MTEAIPTPFYSPRNISDEQMQKVKEILGNPEAHLVITLSHAGKEMCNPLTCAGHVVNVSIKGMSPQQIHSMFHSLLDDWHKINGHENTNDQRGQA